MQTNEYMNLNDIFKTAYSRKIGLRVEYSPVSYNENTDSGFIALLATQYGVCKIHRDDLSELELALEKELNNFGCGR